MKPHPEGIELIMRQLNMPPEVTCMIGDMGIDITTGKRAGVRTGITTWGMTESWEEIVSFDADVILEKPEDILLL
jgi:phosphoglycolate phosphatase-like HAD superfamily hydrolase